MPSRSAALLSCLAVAGCAPSESPPRAPSADVHRSTAELRPTDVGAGLMWQYRAQDVVERFDSDAGFRVHFTRQGPNGVPAVDGNDSGVPDFVEAVARVYDEVADAYHGRLGYRRPASDALVPSNGGDGRFDVYLLDFALMSDGAFRVDTCTSANAQICQGYVVQENDFVGYGYPSAEAATRILGSHEYFHAVQAAYDNDQGVVLSEGTAVWATEQFDPSTSDFEGFVHGYLDRPERSLDSPPPGPVPSFAYGSAIFFQFLSEKYGVGFIRALLEATENGRGLPSEAADVADPHWMIQLDALLRRDHASSFAEAFVEFSRWNLLLGAASDAGVSFRNAAAYPRPAITGVTLPHAGTGLRVFYASAQYFSAPAQGRARVEAALVDDPATADDDTVGMALWIAARAGGRVLSLSDAGVAMGTGDDVLVAVVNSARSGTGAVLSKRPRLCVGSPAEVASCRVTLGGVDGGADAGSDAGVDAGLPDAGAPDGGRPEVRVSQADGLLAPAIGCVSAPSVLAGWLAVLVVLRRRTGPRR